MDETNAPTPNEGAPQSHDSAETPAPEGAESNAPQSKLTCKTYTAFWIAGHQGPFVVKHVENCDTCLRVLFGDGKRWKLTVEEEAALQMKNERRAMRRKFVFAAAAGVVAIAAAGWTWNRTRATKPKPNTPLVSPPIWADEARLDSALATGGVVTIQQHLIGASFDDTLYTYTWIAKRRHSQLYGDIINGLGDPRPDFARASISVLWTIPPASLKAFLPQIQSINSNQTTLTIQSETNDIIKVIQKS